MRSEQDGREGRGDRGANLGRNPTGAEGAQAQVEEQAQQEAKDQTNLNSEFRCRTLMDQELKRYMEMKFKIKGEKARESQKVIIIRQETEQSRAHLNQKLEVIWNLGGLILGEGEGMIEMVEIK
jgi:hypothetical protein